MKTARQIPAERRAQVEEALYDAILTLRSVDECRRFFRDLATPAELEALADRWGVVSYLEEGRPYREIHELTGVSVTTIGRVARFLTDGHGGYALAWRRLHRAANQEN